MIPGDHAEGGKLLAYLTIVLGCRLYTILHLSRRVFFLALMWVKSRAESFGPSKIRTRFRFRIVTFTWSSARYCRVWAKSLMPSSVGCFPCDSIDVPIDSDSSVAAWVIFLARAWSTRILLFVDRIFAAYNLLRVVLIRLYNASSCVVKVLTDIYLAASGETWYPKWTKLVKRNL